MRVFLIEDHRMVREALCEVLTKDPDIDVVGQAGDAADGLERVTALKPDVVVLDIRLPDLNGIEVAARLRASSPSSVPRLPQKISKSKPHSRNSCSRTGWG